MISTVLRELPAFVKHDGCTFQLIVTIEQDKKATLAYIVTEGSPAMPYWFNMFEDHKKVKHLVKYENITSEMSLRQGIHHFKKFLHALQSK